MRMAELCLIWAQSNEGAIGRNGDIPWHSKKDFSHFRKTTLECPVIMGRKTWDSLPKKPLQGRHNIIVSSTLKNVEGATVVATLAEAIEVAQVDALDRFFVIGGASLYAEALPFAQRVFRTLVDIEVADADTFAPSLGPEWQLLKSKADFDEELDLTFEELGKS